MCPLPNSTRRPYHDDTRRRSMRKISLDQLPELAFRQRPFRLIAGLARRNNILFRIPPVPTTRNFVIGRSSAARKRFLAILTRAVLLGQRLAYEQFAPCFFFRVHQPIPHSRASLYPESRNISTAAASACGLFFQPIENPAMTVACSAQTTFSTTILARCPSISLASRYF